MTAVLMGASGTAIYVGQDVDGRHRVVARREGRETDLAMVGGTRLSHAGRSLTLDQPGIKWSQQARPAPGTDPGLIAA